MSHTLKQEPWIVRATKTLNLPLDHPVRKARERFYQGWTKQNRSIARSVVRKGDKAKAAGKFLNPSSEIVHELLRFALEDYMEWNQARQQAKAA